VAGGGSLLYQVQPGYDAASNVTAADTTLPGSVTDNQSFCYDEQNRLTWASSYSGTGPCGLVNNGGSLTAQGAKYTATYSYDTLDRLLSGPAGSSYSYGDSAHLHAATSTSGGYSATYDAAGDMTCRAPTSSTTCTGSSPTGAGLTYDNEGQLVAWTSALNGTPTPSRDTFAYDGEGARVAQQTTSPTGIMTTTDYLLGGLEEQQTVGGSVRPSSTLSEYYPIPGIGTAVRVTTSTSSTSTLSYLAGDQLGSVSVALSTSGTVTAQALYAPYGTVRYSSGSMPTAHGYTGRSPSPVGTTRRRMV
ncbi:MAG TPA: hypothetical protein VF116_20640, partial [Ktedonobacterales bacterium]